MRRTFVDRDPGVLRPWLARDGALIRLRLVGGALPSASLRAVAEIAADLADPHIHLTSRANLQLRSLDHDGGRLPDDTVSRIACTGLFPSPSHDLVRNILVSPLTGRLGGRADLRPVACALDAALLAEPELAGLPGLFWFSLDDGRGDVAARSLDVGLVALDAETAQIRVGSQRWDAVLPLDEAPAAMLELAHRFQMVRGTGNTALWHVDELPAKGLELLDDERERDARTQVVAGPPAFGMLTQDDGRRVLHVEVPDGALTHELALEIAEMSPELVVTPWRSILVPDLGAALPARGPGPGPHSVPVLPLP